MERSDDASIPDVEPLWRRIHPAYLKTRADGGFDVSSAAFRDKSGELSVHLSSLTTRTRALSSYPTFSLAEFAAGVPRELGMGVCRDPLPEDPSHALVFPSASKGQAKRLAERCILVVTTPSAS